MFELNEIEFNSLRSQIVTSNRRGSRYMPFAFTEQGIAMLSSVLNREKAIAINISIIRAFVTIRQFNLTYGRAKRKNFSNRRLISGYLKNTELFGY